MTYLEPLLHAQTQVTIGASKDNTLYEDATGALSNGAGQHMFAGKNNSGGIRRALLAFDVAGKVPQGATIVSAMLILNMSQTVAFGQQINLHRALADWGEGTSIASGNEGGGAPATTGDATWVHRFFSTFSWSSRGGDFSATPSAGQTAAGVGSYTWGSDSQMVSDVQEWLNTPSSNFGWVLVGNEGALQTTKRFDSRDNPIDTVRPRLVVTYQAVAGVDEQGTIERTHTLSQNYPNPFNPATTISYSLSHRSHISLKLYDVLGMKVATIAEGDREAGTHTVVLDGAALATGVYYYRLQAGDYTQTRKLLLIR